MLIMANIDWFLKVYNDRLIGRPGARTSVIERCATMNVSGPNGEEIKILELSARAVSESSISKRRCFACGGASSTGAGEHVIPKWLPKMRNCCWADGCQKY